MVYLGKEEPTLLKENLLLFIAFLFFLGITQQTRRLLILLIPAVLVLHTRATLHKDS